MWEEIEEIEDFRGFGDFDDFNEPREFKEFNDFNSQPCENSVDLYCYESDTDTPDDKKSKRCAVPDCGKRASQGKEWGRPTHCKKHSRPEHVSVTNKRCYYVDEHGGICITRPSHGFANVPNPIMERCSAHSEKGMTLLSTKIKCSHGCGKNGHFHLPDNDLVRYCFEHSTPDMILKHHPRRQKKSVMVSIPATKKLYKSVVIKKPRKPLILERKELLLGGFIISEESKKNYAIMRAAAAHKHDLDC